MFHGFEWDEAQSAPWWASTGMPEQPALDLNFTSGVFRRNGLIRDLDQILSFARATPATYIGADGVLTTAPINAPRFDHSSGARALLMEPAATNLLTYSSDIEIWGWDGIATEANVATAPDGTLTADRIVETASENHHRVKKMGLSISPQSYTASIYAKAEEGAARALQITMFDGAGGWQAVGVFDLTPGAVRSKSGSSLIDARITALADGWVRCELIGACTLASANAQVLFNLIAPGGTIYAGDGVSSLTLWGAQLEVGPRATSLIQTGSTPAIRAQDVLGEIDLAPFWAGSVDKHGTIVVDAAFRGQTSTTAHFLWDIGAANNRIYLTAANGGTMSGQMRLGVGDGTSVTVAMNNGNVLGRHRTAVSYADGGACAAAIDGALRAVTPSSFAAGGEHSLRNIFGNFNGLARSLTLYPAPLTEAELVEVSAL